MSNESFRHHYIPQFYQRRWTGPDKKLAVFQHQHHGLIGRRMSTKATGREDRLYSLSALPPGRQDALEKLYMQQVDDVAAAVIQLFIDGSVQNGLSSEHSDGWSRFLMSLIHRTPRGIATIKAEFAKVWAETPYTIDDKDREDFEKIRTPKGPQTVEEHIAVMNDYCLEVGSYDMIHRLTESEFLGTCLNGMRRSVFKFDDNQHDLLTSDQPLSMRRGFGDPWFFLMIAISPKHLFVCTNTDECMSDLQRQMASGIVVLDYNATVCTNADRFVYGRSLSELNFVRLHFKARKDIQPRPMYVLGPAAE